jgi:glycopeptide antibiotics resistance protein
MIGEFAMLTWLLQSIVFLAIPATVLYIIIRLLFVKKYKINLRMEMIRIAFLSYLVCFISIVWLKPTYTLNYIPFNAIPFKTIAQYFIALPSNDLPFLITFSNLLGNIVLTVPLGFFIFLINKRIRTLTLALIASSICLFIEFVQLVLHLLGLGTRIIDIDDVILNIVGIYLGYYVTKCLTKSLPITQKT